MEVLILVFALVVMLGALFAGVAGLPLVLGVGAAAIGALVISRAIRRRRIRLR